MAPSSGPGGREHLASDCIVVGAGFSGLAAAMQLRNAGLEPLVLEARDRVGGRTWSVDAGDGTIVDLGAQWVGASHSRLLHLGEAHEAPTFLQHSTGSTIIRVRGRSVRTRGKVPFALGPVTLAALAPALLRLDHMARGVSVQEPWSSPHAEAWDAQTVEGWLQRHVLASSARSVCRAMLSGIFAAEPAEISLLHALTYIKAAGGLEELTGTRDAAQHACFRDGMQGLAERIATDLDGRIRLGQPVRRIRQDGESVSVETDELVVTGRRVVVAIPPTLTGRIDYAPRLPGSRDQLTQRVPQGSAIKCIAIYAEPFWRGDELSGLVLDCDGPISMIIDGTPDGSRRGVLIGFFEGGPARRAGGLSPEERRAQVLDCFARHLGPDALTPLAYRDQDWGDEAYTRGCYAGVMPPGAWTSFGPDLRRPIGRIHWAGTETAVEWMGYVEGALEAGERAAGEIVAAET